MNTFESQLRIGKVAKNILSQEVTIQISEYGKKNVLYDVCFYSDILSSLKAVKQHFERQKIFYNAAAKIILDGSIVNPQSVSKQINEMAQNNLSQKMEIKIHLEGGKVLSYEKCEFSEVPDKLEFLIQQYDELIIFWETIPHLDLINN